MRAEVLPIWHYRLAFLKERDAFAPVESFHARDRLVVNTRVLRLEDVLSVWDPAS